MQIILACPLECGILDSSTTNQPTSRNMIYTPTTTAAIFDAITAAESGNNGYAHITPPAPEVVQALAAAGYPCIAARDAFGAACSRVYTPKAWAIAIDEHNALTRALVDKVNAQQARKGNAF